MQLIKRTTLLYQEASSDKVYEVDLCQTGQNRYLVNFRYGRRGSNLKEGTKTTQAVPLAEAERVFDKLVREKVNKGYRDTTNQPTTTTPAPTTTRTDVNITSSDPRHQAILNRLANRDNSKWSLDRVIWRAGELKIKEATPLLIQLLGTGEPLRDYCIAWALGWCGGKGTIPTLIRLYQSASSPDFVSRIAYDALLKLSDAETKAGLQAQMIDFLPAQLQQLAQNGSAQAFTTALKTYLDSSDYKRFAVLDTIYQIDNEYVRPALLDILCEAPLKPNYFKQIRHIFKMAEYRHDSEIFGMLAYAFEKESGNYDSDGYYVRLPGGGYLTTQIRQWDTLGISEFEAEMRKPNPRLAYSKQTREYLRKRVWRTLKQLGEESDREYVKMAVDFLLQYSDRDAQQVRQTIFYRWNRSNWTRIEHKRSWDAYAPYLTFNHILYENSPRYLPHPKAWQCNEGYKPGDPEPNVREEAFPELWQKHPEALLQLLLESECRPVHHFAVKAIRVSREYCDRLDTNTLILLLNKPYEITVEFAFSLAATRYNPTTPNQVLVLTVANCISQNARTQAYRWIEAQREYFFTSSEFIANLVTSEQADTRTFARRLLSSSILDNTTAKVLIARIIAAVLALEPTQTDMAREMGETLLVSFTPQLRNLGLGIILDLLGHPMPEIQELGARILLNHETKAVDLPPDLIELLLASPHESVRGIGVRIFGQLPDDKLLSDRTLITAMAINAVTDIRNAIRPVIRRLANNNTDFASAIATDLIDVLIVPEKHEGVHKDVVQLLKEDIPNWMFSISKDKTMQLLRAKSSVAQELAGLVLLENSVSEAFRRNRFLFDFQISEIVKLANHEILAIREAARQMFVKNLNHIRTNSQAMLSAVRLLESKWEDTRQFATTIFNNNFTEQDWTPEVIVSICESIREDVRTFGRDLVTRHFQQTYGQEYLLKFSEHPSADMQMFATNYIENYAVDNPQRLQQLTPYFISILSSVNRGRIAKQRIFAFLEIEAKKSEQAAQIVAQILTRQSLTLAIGDKATTIKLMLLIHKTYPQIPLPLHLKPVTEIRN